MGAGRGDGRDLRRGLRRGQIRSLGDTVRWVEELGLPVSWDNSESTDAVIDADDLVALSWDLDSEVSSTHRYSRTLHRAVDTRTTDTRHITDT